MNRVAGAAVVLGLGALIALGRSVPDPDEAWFLQVVDRVASGDVLYRDVFFGVTPLSVYLVAPLAAAWQSEVWLVRAVMVGCVTATALVSSEIVRPLGSDRELSPVLALSLLLFAFPVPCAPYAPLATLFLLASLAAVLSWDGAEASIAARSWWPLALAGAASGLSFALKQNVGLYGVAAVLLLVLSARSPGGTGVSSWRGAGIVALSFLLVVAACLLPIWRSGARAAFLEYAFLNKGTYLRRAGLSYFDGLRALADLLRSAPFSLSSVDKVRFLLPSLAMVGLAWTWLRTSGRDRRAAVIVATFCGVAGLAIFPRADEIHIAYVVPVFLVALAFAWDRLGLGRTRGGRLARVAAGVGLVAILLPPALRPLWGLAEGTSRLSTLPHFRGLLMPAPKLETLRLDSEHLRKAAGEKVFLLSVQASFYHLVSGLRNATPFDYPLVTAFGRQGEAAVIADIRAGRVQTVCAEPDVLTSELRPPLLAAFVESEMVRDGDLRFCTLYRRGS